MNVRRLGCTHLFVSPIGLGLAAIGRPGYITLGHAEDLSRRYERAAMEAHAHRLFDTAWEMGVRYFDVARSYGLGEHFLSKWLTLRRIAAGSVTVGSKWGYTYTARWKVFTRTHEVKDHSLKVLRRQWQESRDALSPWLRLYQVHSATFSSRILENMKVLDELARLKGHGICIGLTLSGPDQSEVLKRAMEVHIEGLRVFDCVQATWNLLEPSAGPALRMAHSEGMGVIVKEALANGRLTSKNEEPEFTEKLKLLELQAKRLHTSIDALALAAPLSKPWCDVALSGAATLEHLQSNLKALDVAWDDGASHGLAALAEPPEIYWKQRSRLPWN